MRCHDFHKESSFFIFVFRASSPKILNQFHPLCALALNLLLIDNDVALANNILYL